MQSEIIEFANSFEPVTNNIGFLNAPLEKIVTFCNEWLIPQEIGPAERFNAPFDAAIQHLFPMTHLRFLFIECRNGWTALFRDSTDLLQGKIAHIAGRIPCRGIAIQVVEDTYNPKTDSGRLGGFQFCVLEPFKTDCLNYGRVVSVIREHEGWQFHTDESDPLPFEDLEKYKSRNVRDRFTPEMLSKYLHALGIDAFSREFYGTRCALFDHD